MKRLAPIVIVYLIGSYFLSIIIVLGLIFSFVQSGWLRLVLALIALVVLAFVLALIATLITRLKEIKKEEEDDDDLSQY